MFSYYAFTKKGERFQFTAMSTTAAIDYCSRNGHTFGGVLQTPPFDYGPRPYDP